MGLHALGSDTSCLRSPQVRPAECLCLCGDERQGSQNVIWLEGCSVRSSGSYPPSPCWVLWGKKTCPLPLVNILSCRRGQTCLPGPRAGRAHISAVAMGSYLQRQD